MSMKAVGSSPSFSSPDVERVALEEKNKAAISILLKNATSALQKKSMGDVAEYNKLMQLFNQSPSSMLGVWFSALSQCVGLVNQQGKELLNALFQYNYEETPETTIAFFDFLVSIASFNHSLIGEVMIKLIKSFSSNPNVPADQMEFLFGSIQTTISRVASISPSCITLLYNKLLENYPHKSQPLFTQEMYLHHIFFISKKYPVLREKIISLIIDKFVQIDVEIGDQEDEEEDLMFELDSSQSIGEQNTQKELVDKLDSLMYQFFGFIEQTFLEGNNEVANEIFEILLKSFERLLLPSASKFTQFLLFFICSKNTIFSQKFLTFLFSKALTITQFNNPHGSFSPKLLSQSSAIAGQYSVKETCLLYVGSFLARLKMISADTLSQSCILLANWAAKYIDQFPLSHPDVAAHSYFYLITHSLLYVFCFKIDDLLDTLTRDEILQNLRLSSIIQSKLNPLKVCPKTVVHEFIATLKEKKMNDLAQICESSLYRSSTFLGTEKNIQLENHIDLRYPFDPYLLPKSSPFIDQIYNHWNTISTSQGSLGDADNSDDDDDDSQDSNSSHRHSASFSDDDLSNYMSFTPDTTFDVDFHLSSYRK